MRYWLSLALVSALMVLAAGCGTNAGKIAQTVEITVNGMSFEPALIQLKVGETSRIVLKNKDSLVHDLTIEGFKGKATVIQDTGGHSGGHGHSGDQTHISAGAGKSASMDLLPQAAGIYEVYCTVPGHREAGMVAKLEVR